MTAPVPPTRERLLQIIAAATKGKTETEMEKGQHELINLAQHTTEATQIWIRICTIFKMDESILRPSTLLRFHQLCPFKEEHQWARELLIARAKREAGTRVWEQILDGFEKQKSTLPVKFLQLLLRESPNPAPTWIQEELCVRCRKEAQARIERERLTKVAFKDRPPRFFTQGGWALEINCSEH